MDLKRFQAELRQAAKRMQERTDEAVGAAALAALDAAVGATPVDTGEAVSNWRLGIGITPTKRLAPYVPGRRGSTAGANRAAAMAAGRATVLGKRLKGRPIYLANNAPHIRWILDGSPTIVAHPLDDIAISAAQRVLRNKKVL